MRVIWVARNHDGVGIVEAHFGGTRDQCLRFRQINHMPPDGCCAPRSDMSGVVISEMPPPENGRMFVSWSLDSHTQHAILSDNIVDLPLSMIQLDPPQERIARSPPPLLIESRSGTGKTLVLLQHPAFYHRTGDPRPACFITVSPRLRNELDKDMRTWYQFMALAFPRPNSSHSRTSFLVFSPIYQSVILLKKTRPPFRGL